MTSDALVEPDGDNARPRALYVPLLDALRGYAALFVVIHHASFLLWSGPMLKGGRVAVLLFFFISGFCIQQGIGRNSTSSVRPPTWAAVSNFGMRRARRLYPAMLVAIGLVASLDAVGVSINPSYYAGLSGRAAIDILTASTSHSLTSLAGALTFQSSVLTPVFGTGIPMWSLGYESWYYLLFPIAWYIGYRWRPLAYVLVAVGVSLLMIALEAISGPTPALVTVFLLWTTWISGAYLADVHAGRAKHAGLWWVGLGGVAVAFLAVILHNQIIIDLSLAALFYLLLARALTPATRVERWILATVTRFGLPLGRISYSLYLVHYPLFAFFGAVWLTTNPRLPRSPMFGLVAIATSVVVSIISYRVAERPFLSPWRRSAFRAGAA